MRLRGQFDAQLRGRPATRRATTVLPRVLAGMFAVISWPR